MRWTKEQLANHPKRDSLLDINRKKPAPARSKAAKTVKKVFSFAVRCVPMGKPRMTQRDKWMQRPVVMRYRRYCDRIRAAAKRKNFNPNWNCYAIKINAYLPLRASWSKKKKLKLVGCLMRNRPDFDNICKGILDSLFKEDSVLGGGSCWKYWCEPGQERLSIWIYYLDKHVI